MRPSTLRFIAVPFLVCLILAGETPPARSSPDALYTLPYCDQVQLDVEPAEPSTSESILLTASGEWGSSCVPEFDSLWLGEGYVRVNSIAEKAWACLAVVMPWVVTATVPARPAGPDSADFYISVPKWPWVPSPVLCATKNFSIVGENRYYLPFVLKDASGDLERYDEQT